MNGVVTKNLAFILITKKIRYVQDISSSRKCLRFWPNLFFKETHEYIYVYCIIGLNRKRIVFVQTFLKNSLFYQNWIVCPKKGIKCEVCFVSVLLNKVIMQLIRIYIHANFNLSLNGDITCLCIDRKRMSTVKRKIKHTLERCIALIVIVIKKKNTDITMACIFFFLIYHIQVNKSSLYDCPWLHGTIYISIFMFTSGHIIYFFSAIVSMMNSMAFILKHTR